MKSFNMFLKTLITGIILFTAVSCEDYFNPDTDNYLSEKNSYEDFLSARSSVNGLYALMQDLMTSYIVLGELRGDLLKPTQNTQKDLMDIYMNQYTPENSYSPFTISYRIISNCNDAIFHLEKIINNGLTYETDLKIMYAEAMIVRSWTYFFLLRTYGEVPYITEDYAVSGNNDIQSWLNENTLSNVDIDILISSVLDVIQNLPKTTITRGHFFNLASANAFLGEMYLWKSNYAFAIEALKASVATSDYFRFVLDLDLENAKWVNIFKGDESATDDIMTKVVFSNAEKQHNELMPIFSRTAPEGFRLMPTPYILQAITGHRKTGTFKNTDEVGKYTRSLDDPFISDMPVILYRGADVHLMLAEAYNRQGMVNVALDLVNKGSDSLFTAFSKGVRGRVGLPNVVIGDVAPTLADSIIAIEDIILEERALEMAFEGKRWFDILRIAHRRDDPEVIVNLLARKYDNDESESLRQFFSNKANWYLSWK